MKFLVMSNKDGGREIIYPLGFVEFPTLKDLLNELAVQKHTLKTLTDNAIHTACGVSRFYFKELHKIDIP